MSHTHKAEKKSFMLFGCKKIFARFSFMCGRSNKKDGTN